ncbi:MarR family winged helix-turn-helix transcriptional regulator [Catenuloplanes sp. NPDC051500]|uniref:MarR family winged helix-turn-helix transcriptional regulator n=1 Tax=Catenuloplanes sp. NPDC051500 TaxID=3363959 RepID=UPI00378B2991
MTDEPRWLDEDELKTWLAFVSMFMRLPAALDAQMQRDAGLSHFEYIVMAGLSDAPGRQLRISLLARMSEGSLPRMSQAIGRLEKRGWVRRAPDPSDGRYTLAILTDEGMAKVVASAPGHVEEVRRLVFDPLTKIQPKQLYDISARIMRTIDPDGPLPGTRPF